MTAGLAAVTIVVALVSCVRLYQIGDSDREGNLAEHTHRALERDAAPR